MPRALRLEYPGAMYHILNRGDRREPIFHEECDRTLFLNHLRLDGAELGHRAKGDARKIRIARRLRTETAVTLKWIAAALRIGTWTHVSNLLAQPPEPINQAELNLCQ